jgi:hypothetical protein
LCAASARARARSKKEKDEWYQLVAVLAFFVLVLGLLVGIDIWHKSTIPPKHPVFED